MKKYESLPWIEDVLEENVIDLVVPFVSDSPNILEAGCSSGDDTLRFKAKWPNCKILGFEPLPDHYNYLISRVSGIPGIEIIHKAVCDKEGTITFYQSGVVSGASSILQDNMKNIEIPDSVESEKDKKEEIKEVGYSDSSLTVPTTTFDIELEKRDFDVEFIWLDLEGAELIALNHGMRAVDSARAVVVEVNFQEFRKGGSDFDSINQFFTENGFELKYIWGNPEWQANCLYIKE